MFRWLTIRLVRLRTRLNSYWPKSDRELAERVKNAGVVPKGVRREFELADKIKSARIDSELAFLQRARRIRKQSKRLNTLYDLAFEAKVRGMLNKYFQAYRTIGIWNANDSHPDWFYSQIRANFWNCVTELDHGQLSGAAQNAVEFWRASLSRYQGGTRLSLSWFAERHADQVMRKRMSGR